MALQRTIKDAKVRAWKELIETIDRDPWVRPYRLVLRKLRVCLPPSRNRWIRNCYKESLTPFFARPQSTMDRDAKPGGRRPPLADHINGTSCGYQKDVSEEHRAGPRRNPWKGNIVDTVSARRRDTGAF